MRPGDVASAWDVGAVHALRPLDGGSINGAYRVQAERGEFHLRVYRSPDPARAEREHAAIALAVRVGLPTPAPLPTREGQTVAHLSGRLAALFSVAPGTPLPRASLTPGQAAALGRFLAEVHDRLPAGVPFEVPAVQVGPVERAVERAVERLEQVQAAVLALPHPDEVDGWALERTQQRLAFLRASPPAEYAPASPARFLHGDYHDGNVFFGEGQPTALIDWEQTRLAPRAWEIVRCLALSLGLNAARCGAFLRGYRERLPLPAEELADGAALYAALQARNVWTFASVYLEGNPGPRAFIRPPPYLPFEEAWERLGLD